MKNILKYTSLLLILLVFSNRQGAAQDKRIIGPRFGVDVSGLVWQYAVPERQNIGITADFEINPHFYTVVEAGRLETNRKEETHHYFSKGYYGKVGFDYNFLEPKIPAKYDMLYGGFRFGASRFRHRANDILISEGYWGDFTGSLPQETMNAFWAEAVVGIKTEVLQNLFFGWTVRGQLMLFKEKDNRMTPWLIPGYGKAASNTSVYFTYSISYRLPLFRVNSKNP